MGWIHHNKRKEDILIASNKCKFPCCRIPIKDQILFVFIVTIVDIGVLLLFLTLFVFIVLCLGG